MHIELKDYYTDTDMVSSLDEVHISFTRLEAQRLSNDLGYAVAGELDVFSKSTIEVHEKLKKIIQLPESL